MVLILGETGTGKELIARGIHRMSRRKDGPFIKLNCAAIPTGLLESELFGHEGRVHRSHQSEDRDAWNWGTAERCSSTKSEIFLWSFSPNCCVFLRQEFEHLGSNRTIRVDVRVVTATNRDLAKDVAEHQFRSVFSTGSVCFLFGASSAGTARGRSAVGRPLRPEVRVEDGSSHRNHPPKRP